MPGHAIETNRLLIAANPLRDGMPWGGFAVVGATTLALAGLAVLALRRRDVQLGN